MDNKFYYKTPALLLMMFAAHTTAAHAAENDTSQQEELTAQTTQEVSSTEEAAPYNVTATTSASDINSLSLKTTAATTVETDQSAVSTASTIEKSTEAAVSTDTAEATQSTETTKAATAEATTPDSTETPAVEAAAPESTETTAAEAAQIAASTELAQTAVSSEPAAESAAKSEATVKSQTIGQGAAITPKTTTTAALTQPKTTTAPTAPKITLTAAKTTAVTTNTAAAKAPADMSINEYIKYMNYQAPVYQTSYSSDIPQLAYRYGVGNPEGIVAHETANNTSTIWGEIAYMKNNFKSAFVHAFVDDNNIVETAPTDYLAWGAGPYANDRFIQVELVRVQGKDRFAKAMNNYADYIAENLLYYGLPVDSAEYDGSGTLWSHKAVSAYLGGTDHSDPYGWFQQNGYTFDELVQLVTEKYSFKANGTTPATPAPPAAPAPAPSKTGTVSTSTVSKMARIKSASTPVYTSVTDAAGKPADSKYGLSYYVNKKAVFNGKTYYALTDQAGIGRGWVESANLTQATRSAEKAVSTKYKINSLVSGIYSVPWGTSAQKIDSLKTYINQPFNPIKKVTINSSNYYYGTIDKFSGWINSKHLTSASIPVTSPVDLIGRTSSTGVVIYTDNNITKKSPAQSKNMQYYINKQALKGSAKYYQIVDAANQTVGWVADNQIDEKAHSIVNWEKAPYIINNTKTYLYSIPGGSSSQRVSALTSLSQPIFNVVKAEKVGSSLWYKGTLSNKKVGWISGKYLTKQITEKQMAPLSLSAAVDQQMKLVNYATNSGPKVSYTDAKGKTAYRIATRQEVQQSIDTSKTQNDAVQKYQFLALNQAQGISVDTLNKLLVNKGILANQGAAFAQAAKTLNVNEIYLISHALLETGNGTSQLSNGMGFNPATNKAVTTSSTKYFNMYGTKANDNNALNNGIKYAYENGWDTPAKAIIGGAKYVADSYFSNQQVTLHQMRWNPMNTAVHQYATDINWASKNASRIADFYKQIGLEGAKFIINNFK